MGAAVRVEPKGEQQLEAREKASFTKADVCIPVSRGEASKRGMVACGFA